MKKEKRERSKQEKQELNWKIAEVIWYSIGGIFFVGGLVFSVLGFLIINMDGNFKYHPFYGIYKSQAAFIKWLGFGSNYANLGVMLIVLSVIYLLIVTYIFANRADRKAKKALKTKTKNQGLKLVIENKDE